MRIRVLITLVPLALVALAAGNAAAAASPPTYPVMPNQYFNGVVNGKTAAATIKTACPGPATGQTGHPVSGQLLSVSRVSDPSSTTNLGFTGSTGNSIAAAPVSSSVANAPVTLTEYFHGYAIPTAWTVPCEGDGLIAFTPLPGSSTARTTYVTVHFTNIAQ
ncbi:hypothetical protein [Catellatospora tritici]|uniref:hypothetical protein n=1 Tax=Catellatospora tritici TaxID=2851566 RepID=UPI001C2DE3BF|nr:hypothetical protein [Catellatospora tritici]MBV1856633.1 hypothetical protein [Catellatospora tritici]